MMRCCVRCGGPAHGRLWDQGVRSKDQGVLLQGGVPCSTFVLKIEHNILIIMPVQWQAADEADGAARERSSLLRATGRVHDHTPP